jgi:ubiquitin-like modifier-activating enzyme ATG7
LARNLLGWGVKNIDFVDAGTVSYSNPVRQSLYTFEDSREAKTKAEAAAQRLKEVFPSVNSIGHQIKIPMPGHFVSTEKGLDEVMQTVEKMEELVQWADVVFLVTDTRESRWLPTVMAAAYDKLCISVALGFDNYIIIRHGGSPLLYSQASSKEEERKTEEKEPIPDRVGCYFCNDYIAPSNTLADRTLDQQCTVTRPGLSYVSSAYATELMINTLHYNHLKGPIGGHEVKKFVW